MKAERSPGAQFEPDEKNKTDQKWRNSVRECQNKIKARKHKRNESTLLDGGELNRASWSYEFWSVRFLVKFRDSNSINRSGRSLPNYIAISTTQFGIAKPIWRQSTIHGHGLFNFNRKHLVLTTSKDLLKFNTVTSKLLEMLLKGILESYIKLVWLKLTRN